LVVPKVDVNLIGVHCDDISSKIIVEVSEADSVILSLPIATREDFNVIVGFGWTVKVEELALEAI